MDFGAALARAGWTALKPAELEIFQINLGKLCNMTCGHCHVDAGPGKTRENMSPETVDACLRALDKTSAHTVDITGGAPELHPRFRYLVEQSLARGKRVIDRCNLTVLLLPAYRDLPDWFAERGVELVCSLPHYRKLNTDAQRGAGAYAKSIEALKALNSAGYGRGDARRALTLVSNPAGAYLSGDQAELEREWKKRLAEDHGVYFDRLLTLNNMPIARFLEWLEASGNLDGYLELLVRSFNPATVAGLMCRNTISIGWDGRVFDCDFNQMLEIDAVDGRGRPVNVRDFDAKAFDERTIRVGRHCFGCTAGAGSGCGGAIEKTAR